MPDASDPRAVHNADQLGAHLRLAAKILGEYLDELLAQGFSRDEALTLCMEMQAMLIEGRGELE